MKKLLAALLTLSLALSLTACITIPPVSDPAPPTTEPITTQTEEAALDTPPIFDYVVYEDTGVYIPTEPTEDGQFLEELLRNVPSRLLSRSYLISELKEDEYSSLTFRITYQEGMRATMCRPPVIADPQLFLLLHIPDGMDAEAVSEEVYENATAFINPSTIAEEVCVYTLEDKVLLTLCPKELSGYIGNNLGDTYSSDLTCKNFFSGFSFQHVVFGEVAVVEIVPTEMGALLEALHGRCYRVEMPHEFHISEIDPYRFLEMTGTDPTEGMEAYYCSATFLPESTPHTAVLLKVPEGTDVAALCDSMQNNANLQWGWYSSAETVAVASHENMILFVMSTEEIAHTLMETFDDLIKK